MPFVVAVLALLAFLPASRARAQEVPAEEAAAQEAAGQELPGQEATGQEATGQNAVAPAEAAAGEEGVEPPVGAENQPGTDHDGEGRDRSFVVPNLDLFFPEGEFELRLHRLIDRVFFEGQVNYNFVDGDIRAYLRYRYFGYQRTYRLTVFDTLEFRDFQNSDEFERVRGGLFLVQWPYSYHHRTFLLTEIDNITTNRESAQTNGELSAVNTFIRLSYQVGTPDDDRSNSIVGDNDGQVRRLFTPYRHIGPGDSGLTVALTWGFDFLSGEYDYVRSEAEALKRFELPRSSFLFGRLSAGTFLRKGLNPNPASEDPRDVFLIPRREFFRLDGRENLKGLNRQVRGTEELHTTWELLLPYFVDEERKALGAVWRTWYWVVYAGYGTAGFDREVYSDLKNYVADVGLGFQSSFAVKGYTLFFSALVARELESNADLKIRLSVKSFH